MQATAGQALHPELDSLLGVWRNSDKDANDRLSAFHEGYARFHQEFPEEFLAELDALLQLGLATDRPVEVFEAHIRRGGLLNYRGENERAFEAYDRAEEVAASMKDTLRLGSVEANRGNAYATNQDYVKALEHFVLALKHYDKVGDAGRSRKVRMALGSVFALLDDHVLAKAYYREIESQTPEGEEHDFLLALLHLNLGWSHYKLGEYESAIALSVDALETLQKHNSGFHIAGCWSNLARIHLDLGELDLANLYLDSSQSKCEALGSVDGLVDCTLMRAEIAHLKGMSEHALVLTNRLSQEMSASLDLEDWKALHRLKYQAQKSLGDIQAALDEYEKFHAYHDSLQIQKNSLTVARAAYEKDMEHAVHVVKMEAQQKRDRQKLAQLNLVLGLILGFGLVVALLVATMMRMRASQNKKRQRLLDEIDLLKTSGRRSEWAQPSFETLSRMHVEDRLGRALNETDWKVLNLLFENPTITNAQLAERACLSVDGIGSSLRRMYDYFDIQETKYKKIALLHAAVTMSKDLGHSHPQA